jgi:predicted ATPase
VVEARSGGNPLFVWELGRLMGLAGRTEVGAAAIPPAVRAVIGRRLARLNESVVSVLRAAAVVGKEFSAGSVEAVLDADADAVASALAAAVGSGVLVRTDRADAGFGFAHDLIREVVIDAMSPSQRAALHLRAAGDCGTRLSADPALHAVVVAHLEQAGGQHLDESVRHWEAAGRLALAMLSYEQAAAHYARALRAMRPDGERRADLLLAQADALVRAGELAAGRARFSDAADAARVSGSADRLAAAALGIGAGVAGWEVPMWDQRHIDLLDEALVALGADDSALRSMLLARLSVAGSRPDSNEESRRLAEEALALARRAGEPSVIAQALAALCDALAGPEHATAPRQHAAVIVEMAERAGERGLALLGRRFSVVALLELGDFPALDREIALFERQAGLLRQPLLGWYAPLFRGMRALLRGDAVGAERFRESCSSRALQAPAWMQTPAPPRRCNMTPCCPKPW